MTTEYLAAPGTPELELETPALVIDMDVAESNIERLQKWGRDNNMDIRPHSKTHKTPLFARKQIEAGAIGVCCAKVGEAEVMVAAGIKDIMITCPLYTYDAAHDTPCVNLGCRRIIKKKEHNIK